MDRTNLRDILLHLEREYNYEIEFETFSYESEYINHIVVHNMTGLRTSFDVFYMDDTAESIVIKAKQAIGRLINGGQK